MNAELRKDLLAKLVDALVKMCGIPGPFEFLIVAFVPKKVFKVLSTPTKDGLALDFLALSSLGLASFRCLFLNFVSALSSLWYLFFFFL